MGGPRATDWVMHITPITDLPISKASAKNEKDQQVDRVLHTRAARDSKNSLKNMTGAKITWPVAALTTPGPGQIPVRPQPMPKTLPPCKNED